MEGLGEEVLAALLRLQALPLEAAGFELVLELDLVQERLAQALLRSAVVCASLFCMALIIDIGAVVEVVVESLVGLVLRLNLVGVETNLLLLLRSLNLLMRSWVSLLSPQVLRLLQG